MGYNNVQAKELTMTFKESLLAVGTSLFVCSGVAGVIAFVALYYFLMSLGE